MRSFHRSLVVAGAVALGIAVAGAAHAQTTSYTRSESTTYVDQSDWDVYNRPGPYVGVGGSYTVPGFQGGARSADFGDTLGFNVRGGYRVNEYWAFEGLYEYGDFNAHDVLAARREGERDRCQHSATDRSMEMIRFHEERPLCCEEGHLRPSRATS